jgi:Na+-driven multidrug efflux pump
LRIFFSFAASPGGVKIALPIVMAQHKGHGRIGEARKRFHRSLLIGPKIAI